MSKLLVVAPNTDLYKHATEIVQEAFLQVSVIQATSENVLSLVENEFAGDTGVIVARGHQAQILRSGQKLPVVDIVLSGQDMALLMDRARKQLSHSHPKLAFVGFRYMFSNCELLAQILEVDACIYYASSGREVPQVVSQAIEEGAELIIGGEMACRAAARHGLPYLFMDSMKESLRSAIRTALHMMEALRIEQRRAAEFSTFLDYSFDSILRLDKDGRIVSANYLAQKVLGSDPEHLLGTPFFDRPEVSVSSALKEALAAHRSLYSTVLRIGHESYIANCASFDFEGTHDGYLISLQAFGLIDDLEQKIQHERRRQGYIAHTTFDAYPPHSQALGSVFDNARQYAQYDMPILLTGASGLPKKDLAECIHNDSFHREAPFVHV